MNQEYVKWIYESVIGELVEEYRCKEVENLFEDGKACLKLYSDTIEAYRRLCDRLGIEEDYDVEIIIDSLLEMSQIVACRMYEYGAQFGAHE